MGEDEMSEDFGESGEDELESVEDIQGMLSRARQGML
jgi:hypothetical protein